MDQLEWSDLRTALFLARAGSVRRAARELGVSHSTVLRRLAALEASTGVRIFERKGEGYELTVAGQDVFDSAGALEEIVLGLGRRIEGRDLRLSGPVRLTLPDPFLPLLLPVVHQFSSAHADIIVTLALDLGYVDLAQREADIAVRIATDPPPDLVGQKLVTAGVGIYAAESYLDGRKVRDLAALDWIGWEVGSPMAFARWMQANVPEERVRLRVSTSWAMRDAVDLGAGVAMFPCALGAMRPNWRRLRLMKDGVPLWLLTHKDLRTTARVRVLRDALAKAIVAKRGVIEGTSR